MRIKALFGIILLSTICSLTQLKSQNLTQKLNFPDLDEMQFTPFHAYFCMKDGSIALYRFREDGLTYLFTNEYVANRGKLVHSDIRFAYLLNEQNEITILDPNSLLLVTQRIALDFEPLKLFRQGNWLMIFSSNFVQIHPISASDQTEVKRLSIPTEIVADKFIQSSSNSADLFVLSNSNELLELIWQQGDSMYTVRSVQQLAEEPVSKLLAHKEGSFWFTDQDQKSLFRFDSTKTELIYQFEEEISNFVIASDDSNKAYVITENENLWSVSLNEPLPAKLLIKSGGLVELVQTKNALWLRKTNRVEYIQNANFAENEEGISIPTNEDLGLSKPQFDQFDRVIHPVSEYLIIPMKLKSGWRKPGLYFELNSAKEASIEDRSFIWKPSLADVGTHEFDISMFSDTGLEDQQKLIVDVRPFNAPPEFLPQRSLTIVAEEQVSLSVRALDPDGADRTLLRYRGRGFSEGMQLQAKEGLILWKPSSAQVGMHEFEIIATDQYGASANKMMQVKVVTNPNSGKGDE